MDDSARSLAEWPGQIQRICFIGDSQSRVLDGRLFTDPSRPGVVIMPVVRRTFYFRARRFFDGERFDARMTHLFWEMKCIIPTKGEPDLIFTPFVFPVFGGTTEQRLLRRNPNAAPIVISCGGVDMWDIEQELLGKYAVDLDSEPSFFSELPPYDAPEHIPQERLVAMLAERCAPVFDGIRALRAGGFENIFVLGMSAPHNSERQGGKPLRLQYAARIAFNQLYANQAPRVGATFIDLWALLSKDGLRDDRYYADIEHVNTEGGAIIVNEIYSKLPF